MRCHRQFAIVAVVLSLVGVPCAHAQAADRSLFSPSSDAPSMGFNWTGSYAGLHVGYARNSAAPASQVDGGHFGGVQAGYNLQLAGSAAAAVFGVELEASYLWQQSSRPARAFAKIDPQWFSAAKLRYGIPIGRFLPFATAGLALVHRAGTNGGLGASEWQPGYLLGGGIEYAMTNNLSIRAEYNYFHMGRIPANDPLEFLHKRNLSTQTAKAAMNIRF